MEKSLVRSTNEVTFSFFGIAHHMKMVSLERRHYNALNVNIFYGIWTCISREITLYSQVPLNRKSD